MSVDRFKNVLVEQLGLLSDSALLFDKGVIRQIKSISTRLFTICHDLTKQREWNAWKAGRNLLFQSHAHPRRLGNLIKSHHPLVSIGMGPSGVSFQAVGSGRIKPPNYLKFFKWWDEVVLSMDHQRDLSRRNIVFQMRNKDGGGHGSLEPVSDDYAAAVEDRGVGWAAISNGEPTSFVVSALEATTRQIAHEVLATFYPYLSYEEQLQVGYSPNWNGLDGSERTFFSNPIIRQAD